jgi:hypothetical protein
MKELLELAREAAGGNTARFRGSKFSDYVYEVEAKKGPNSRVELLRETLLELADENVSLIESLNYPRAVRALIRKEFERIRKQGVSVKDEYYSFSTYKLICDYRIVCFSRVPVGPQHIELAPLRPRGLLSRGGVRQVLKFLSMLGQTRGLSPFYATHMSQAITAFNFIRTSGPDARRKMFLNIAECLERSPHVRGTFSCSWLNDPALDKVSPHLSFFRQQALENGAFLFQYSRAVHEAQADALSNSLIRSRLHGKGEYLPGEYAVIWPRGALIRWAHRQASRRERKS